MQKELRLIITRACNYDCYFCHGEGVDKKCLPLLNSDDYEFLVKTCKDIFGWNSVTLTGGEPLIRKDYTEIVNKLYKLGIKITVVSNGELVNKSIDSFDKIDRLNVSIHSFNPKTYDKIVQRENKLEKVITNLTNLRNVNKDLQIRINTTIVKRQNDDSKDYDNLIDFAERIKASIKIIELFSENKEEIVKLEDIQNVFFEKGFKLKEQDVFKNILTNGKIDVVLSKIFCAMASKYYDPNTFCNANNDIFVTPDGKVKICRYNNSIIDVLEEIKTRNKKKLKEKFLLANEILGKDCPLFLKSKMNELAINGGEPLMDVNEGRFIHPKITPKIVNEVVDQLKTSISIYDRSGIFEEFENDFARYHNKKYGLVQSSGTAALWSLYDAIGLKKGDEVICPVYTFFATVSPIFQTGATPVFVDCDETGNMDYTQVEQKINSHTKAIMVVHMWGYPAHMEKLREIADKYNIYLLEDCSHAHGGRFQNKLLGEWGDASAFSLQGNKIITGGEGGIIITNDKYIYKNALLLGHYNKRCRQEISSESTDYKFAVTGKGLKLRAHPIAIKMAYVQFKDLENIRLYKNCYAQMFMQTIDEIDGLDYVRGYDGSFPSYYAFIIKFDESKFKVPRDVFVKALVSEGCVEADIPSSTNSLMNFELFKNPKYFFSEYKDYSNNEDYPNAKEFASKIIKLPVWYNKEDWTIVNKYCLALKKVAKAFKKEK